MPNGTIDKEDLKGFFHLPIQVVAGELGICTTMLKQLCRKYGIQRWPHRKIQSLNNIIMQLESLLAKPDLPPDVRQARLEELAQAHAKKRLLLEDPNADIDVAQTRDPAKVAALLQQAGVSVSDFSEFGVAGAAEDAIMTGSTPSPSPAPASMLSPSSSLAALDLSSSALPMAAAAAGMAPASAPIAAPQRGPSVSSYSPPPSPPRPKRRCHHSAPASSTPETDADVHAGLKRRYATGVAPQAASQLQQAQQLPEDAVMEHHCTDKCCPHCDALRQNLHDLQTSYARVAEERDALREAVAKMRLGGGPVPVAPAMATGRDEMASEYARLVAENTLLSWMLEGRQGDAQNQMPNMPPPPPQPQTAAPPPPPMVFPPMVGMQQQGQMVPPIPSMIAPIAPMTPMSPMGQMQMPPQFCVPMPQQPSGPMMFGAPPPLPLSAAPPMPPTSAAPPPIPSTRPAPRARPGQMGQMVLPPLRATFATPLD